MGQYFRAITQNENGTKVYNRYVIENGQREYMVAKLTEHSWISNAFVEAVCKDIYEYAKPTRVSWVGDYADEFLSCEGIETFNGLNQEQIEDLVHKCWDVDGEDVEIPNFTIKGKYLINHTKQIYLDCEAYYKRSVVRQYDLDWCLHPLPLLTCIGNGLGGGDYRSPSGDSTFDEVGAWTWDEITIEDYAPKGYTETEITFKESY